jgi:hypothetical protein
MLEKFKTRQYYPNPKVLLENWLKNYSCQVCLSKLNGYCDASFHL